MVEVSAEPVQAKPKPRRKIRWLISMHWMFAIISLAYFVAGWTCCNCVVAEILFGTKYINISDNRGIARTIQEPLLLTYLYSLVFAFCIAVTIGLLAHKPWSQRWTRFTPFMTLPLWTPVAWFVARSLVTNRYGGTSTDPADMSHVTPVADVWHGLVIALLIWAVMSCRYWLFLRKSRMNDCCTSSDNLRNKGNRKYATVAGVAFFVLVTMINFKLADGRMLIHDAADYGWTGVISILSHIGQSVNTRTHDGTTPLHLAAYSGRITTVKYLVNHGANIDALTEDGTTPAISAAAAMYSLWDKPNVDCYPVTLYLVKHRANVQKSADKMVEGVGTIAFSMRKYPAELIRELVNRHFPINTINQYESTLLKCAVEYGRAEDIDYLLRNGARMHPSLAESARPKNMLFLFKRGFDVEQRDNRGRTALDYALDHYTESGTPEEVTLIVKLITQRVANIPAKDNDGVTPLGAADEEQRPVMLKYLH